MNSCVLRSLVPEGHPMPVEFIWSGFSWRRTSSFSQEWRMSPREMKVLRGRLCSSGTRLINSFHKTETISFGVARLLFAGEIRNGWSVFISSAWSRSHSHIRVITVTISCHMISSDGFKTNSGLGRCSTGRFCRLTARSRGFESQGGPMGFMCMFSIILEHVRIHVCWATMFMLFKINNPKIIVFLKADINNYCYQTFFPTFGETSFLMPIKISLHF